MYIGPGLTEVYWSLEGDYWDEADLDEEHVDQPGWSLQWKKCVPIHMGFVLG